MKRMLVERPLPRVGSARVGRRGAPRSVTVNLAESPIGWLRARAMISARQLEAGEKLRRDWEQAGYGPKVTMDWAAPARDKASRRSPPPLHPTVRQAAAGRRVDSAMKAVGTGLTDLLWRLVCAGEGMSEAEAALGWPRSTARIVLCIALDRLADHYRIR
jgi:hypothetical protein